MVLVGLDIIGVHELQEQFIEDEGTDTKAQTANSSTHALPMWEITESVPEADEVGQAEEEAREEAIEDTVAGQVLHEGSEEDAQGVA